VNDDFSVFQVSDKRRKRENKTLTADGLGMEYGCEENNNNDYDNEIMLASGTGSNPLHLVFACAPTFAHWSQRAKFAKCCALSVCSLILLC